MAQRDFVTLGPVPSDENCAQVGEDDYEARARRECKRFIDLLRETFGPEPVGAYLSTKGFPHDFGTYYEVVCYFNERVPESIEYAYRLERDAPTRWGGEPEEDGWPRCPECGCGLEPGNMYLASSHLTSDGYICLSCRMIFANDLTFLATYVG